jgi:hypothetical protein
MSSLSSESVLVRNERLAWRVLEGEAVILFPDVGSLHKLNSTGTRAWEHLDGKQALSGVADALTAEFKVDQAAALNDLQSLAADLLAAGLVQVQEPAL